MMGSLREWRKQLGWKIVRGEKTRKIIWKWTLFRYVGIFPLFAIAYGLLSPLSSVVFVVLLCFPSSLLVVIKSEIQLWSLWKFKNTTAKKCTRSEGEMNELNRNEPTRIEQVKFPCANLQQKATEKLHQQALIAILSHTHIHIHDQVICTCNKCNNMQPTRERRSWVLLLWTSNVQLTTIPST